MTSGRFLSAKNLRKPSSLIRDLGESGETCFITDHGRACAVIMDISRYNALMDLVEESETLREPDGAAELSVRGIIRKATTRIERRRSPTK